jgi:hypothetical protein
MASPSRAFVSFDYDNDSAMRDLLMGQAAHPDTPFEIHDWSVKKPFTGDWKEKVRTRIRQTDVVIVICGESTHMASGVSAEVEIAREERVPYFFLQAYKDKRCFAPRAGLPTDKIYNWTWENLKLLIAGNR